LAFINAWPGAKEEKSCAVAGIDYVKAIISMLSWIRYLRMMLQLLTQSASHLEKDSLSLTTLEMIF
jgi:hypothetical protein